MNACVVVSLAQRENEKKNKQKKQVNKNGMNARIDTWLDFYS